MPAAGWKKLSTEEIRLAKHWYEEELAPSVIAQRLGLLPILLILVVIRFLSAFD